MTLSLITKYVLYAVATGALLFSAAQLVDSSVFQDENANRNSNRALNTNRGNNNANRTGNINRKVNGNSVHRSFAPASLSVLVTPADSTVFLDTQPYDKVDSRTGSFTLSLKTMGPKPQEHTLLVRHAGYSDKEQRITLKSGENPAVHIVLDALMGTLSVAPDIRGTAIIVEAVDPYREFGRYDGIVKELSLPPGEYEVTISKYGYEIVKRSVSIRPAQSIILDLQIPPLPTPTPTPVPTPTPFRPDTLPTSSSVSVQGKELIVLIRGASAEASWLMGSINVSIASFGAGAVGVSGSLTGFPCQVEFIRLENVAEGSLMEAPGPSNRWSRIVVRVRPKDQKRPIRFAINWKFLQDATVSPGIAERGSYLEAVPIQKALPTFPAAARKLQPEGIVNVSVVIDAQGRVVSAKATDGPFVFRQAAEEAARKWKFRPATRDGSPIESTQTIRFNFTK